MNYQKHYDLLISTRSKYQTRRFTIWKNRKKLIGTDKLMLKLYHIHHDPRSHTEWLEFTK